MENRGLPGRRQNVRPGARYGSKLKCKVLLGEKMSVEDWQADSEDSLGMGSMG